MARRYLLWFAQEHLDFRHAEMHSIISMLNIPIKFIENPSINLPYWIVELPSEFCAKQIASRSVLLKNCLELWSRAKSEAKLHENLKCSVKNKSGKWIIPNHNIEISESDICPSELLDAKFSYLPLEGAVNLNKPDVTLSYIEFYGVDPNNVPQQPCDLFFGKWIADGQRDLIKFHTLKKREFIGNTSMDAQLSLIMANQAQVAPGDVVLDPFVGSGSLLVSAAHFGGYIWGADIDFMMLHARTRPTRVGQKVRNKEESIRGNMRQYGIMSQYLDVLVSDFSRPLWRQDLKFDALITDPPYGVREPTEKIGIEKDNYTLSEQHLDNHIPSKVEYGLPHIYSDLLNFAAQHLNIGRRLVCWYPLVRDEYLEEQLPSHPCMQLVGNSEQVLSRMTARRLLTYQKISDDIPNMPHDPHGAAHNFRDKYFAVGEISRREKKERRAEEIAKTAFYLKAKQEECNKK
ncbi:tRNA (guanine(10)-N2)-methyltransferase homolog isoform X2 [Pieris rapae]|uniref:tRNA (guanine(10)-N2)-methyltransferase homolog isoform X2 n=1 Tax=Pieris rapae TaxID=64459 RepID=UPI001E27CB1D|nr:tRNA (guanine(10)-N2)-methyltransferase homolog isoform X2 [Pieris rapae]